MPIKFNCPHCNKAFSVKDDLAGLRRGCPACKKMLTVPAPASAPVNVEEFAAAALADHPEAAAPKKEPQTVEFVCAFCETKVHVAAELAGKQTSCPECRRIVKVPLLEKAGPKDWRKVDSRLPSGARRDVEPAPEGAWDARAVGAVSREALLEADAVPQVKPKRTWQQWVRIGLTAGALALVVSVLAVTYLNYRARTLKERLLAGALDGLDKNPTPEAAELYRAAGEYYLRANPPNAEEAKLNFQRARNAAILQAIPAQPYERDFLLSDLLQSQADLGGTSAEAQEGKHLKWEKAQDEMRHTWQHLESREVRLEALLGITRRLEERGEGKRSRPWAAQFPDQVPELLSVLGLELLRKDPKQAGAEVEMIAENASKGFAPVAVANPAQPAKQKTPPSSLITVWLLLNKPDRAEALVGPQVPGKPADPILVVGFAEAFARQGKWDHVKQLLGKIIKPASNLPALVTVAAVALDLEPPDTGNAVPHLEQAFEITSTYPKLAELSPWLLFRLARLGAKAGMEERALDLAKNIGDAGLRGRAQLEVLRAQLARSNEVVDEAAFQKVDKTTPAHGVAREVWARHNARVGGPGVQKSIDAWTAESDRRFGYMGTVLGLQDAGR